VTTTDDREFLPAMARPGMLRFYDPLSRLTGIREVHWRLVAQAGIEAGATVLEIGCGTGNVLMLAARVAPGTTVIGLDPDPGALAIAGRKLRRAGLDVRLDQGFADRLPYADGSVDRVLSSFMLHHLPRTERQAALREVRRVLVPGGRLHLLDVDGEMPTPHGVLRVLRLFNRRHAHGEHPHDHLPIPAALREAGFTDVTENGHGTSPLGDHTFYRAAR
jgi:ubiquinone/menaquinone biosynthesis C-methylase UbiE